MSAEDWMPTDWYDDDRYDDGLPYGHIHGSLGYTPRLRRCRRCGKMAAFTWNLTRKAANGRIIEVYQLVEPNGEIHVCEQSALDRRIIEAFENGNG